MNQIELYQYRINKIMEAIGDQVVTIKEVHSKLDESGDRYLKLHGGTVGRYIRDICNEGRLHTSTQYDRETNTTFKVLSKSPFPVKPKPEIKLPYDKELSRWAGYAVMRPTTKGIHYAEHHVRTPRNSMLIGIRSGLSMFEMVG